MATQGSSTDHARKHFIASMRRPRNADVILGSHVLVNRERTIVGHSLTRELLAACCSLFARTFGFGFHYKRGTAWVDVAYPHRQQRQGLVEQDEVEDQGWSDGHCIWGAVSSPQVCYIVYMRERHLKFLLEAVQRSLYGVGGTEVLGCSLTLLGCQTHFPRTHHAPVCFL